MESKTKSREWVKTAAIIFLSILLVLTFFSNTIMNRTLPEIASAEVTDGSIVAKVKGTGTVSAIGNTEIKAPGTTTVTLVKAKEGAEVSEGDVLFVLGETSEELQAAQDELDSLRFELQRANTNYSTNSNSAADINIESLFRDFQYAEDALATARLNREQQAVSEEIIKEAKITLDKAKENLAQVSKACEKEVSFAQDEYDLASAAYLAKCSDPSATEEEKAQLLKNMEQKMVALSNAKQKQIDVVNQAAEDVSVAEENYEALLKRDVSVLDELVREAQANLDAAQYAYYSAMDSRDNSNNSANKSNANNYVSILELQNRIAKAEKKVEELQGGEENAVTAPVGGTVTSISTSPGSKIQKDQVLCVIEVPDLGYSMSFSCTNDQAKRIKVGDTASVSNYYWGSEITATVTSIKADPKEPQNKKLVTCTLEGDVNNGSELTVSIGKKSAGYDIVVPNSAVRTDSNGTFVLAVNAKNSALGNRYFAKRVPVEVLASDDDNTALSCDLSYGDFVITTSSAPIKSGDQVRMADNG